MAESVAKRARVELPKVKVDPTSALEFLRELVKKQEEGELAVQAAVAARLKECGCVIEELKYDPTGLTVKNEFATGSAINRDHRVSVIACFKDAETYTEERAAGWKHKPFEGEVDNGKMFGWGCADDLMGVAAGVCALEAVAKSGIKLKGDAIMASTPSKRHARGFIAVINKGYTADAGLYLHPAESGAGLREIKALASGELCFHLTIRGQPPNTTEPGHTAFTHLAVNPLDKAILVHQALTKLGEERAKRVHHPTLHAHKPFDPIADEYSNSAVGRSTNLLIASIRCGSVTKGWEVYEQCEMGASISFPPTEKMADVQAEVQACLVEVAKSDAWLSEHPPVLVWRSGITGSEVKTEHPFYQTVSSSIAEVTGTAPQVNAMHTASDIRVPLVQSGIPCLGIGSLGGSLIQNGLKDEWVDVADFGKFVEVTAQVVMDWCGVAKQKVANHESETSNLASTSTLA